MSVAATNNGAPWQSMAWLPPTAESIQLCFCSPVYVCVLAEDLFNRWTHFNDTFRKKASSASLLLCKMFDQSSNNFAIYHQKTMLVQNSGMDGAMQVMVLALVTS